MRLSLCLDPGRPWADVERLATTADGGSWHALYVCDHFMPHSDDDRPTDGPMLECWTTLSALAGVTRRARLGPLVLGNTYRHPAVVANMAASLDQASRGRLVLGLGAGWQRNEHEAYGIPFPSAGDRVDALDEACTVIRRLLAQDRVTFAGEHYRLTDACCRPGPVQPHLPVLVGGSGPRMLRLAARHADLWHMWAAPVELREKCVALDALCEQLGRDPLTLQRVTGGTVEVRVNVAAVPSAQEADVSGDAAQVLSRLHEYREAGADEFVVVDDASATDAGQAAELIAMIDEELRPDLG